MKTIDKQGEQKMERYVVVRGKNSGVFAGNLAKQKGQEVTLKKVRKLWYWNGACAVEQIAMDGVNKPEDCNFTVVVNEITILDAIQILPCTKKAEKNIKEVAVWKK